MIVKGFEMDPFVSSTLIDMYTKCWSLSEATWIFVKSSDQNVVSCNALMGYTEQGYNEMHKIVLGKCNRLCCQIQFHSIWS